jgi:hypothetical protein
MQVIDQYEANLSRDESIAESEVRYTSMITEMLTKTVRIAPKQKLLLPYVSYFSHPTGGMQVHTVSEVVADECSTGKPLDALMAVIVGSDCPLVAKLREAIATRYAYANASDLAELDQ